jgi:hypothetical protein
MGLKAHVPSVLFLSLRLAGELVFSRNHPIFPRHPHHFPPLPYPQYRHP